MADRDTERLIDAWLDGELPPEQAAGVEAMLRESPQLRQEYSALMTLLRSPDPIVMPPGLADRIKAAVPPRHTFRVMPAGPRSPVTPARWRYLRGALAAAASLALFAGGWFTSQLWTRSAEVVPMGPDMSAPTVVIVSPWVLNGLAQSLTAGGSVNPTPFIVQGAAMEILAGTLPEPVKAAETVVPLLLPQRPAPEGQKPPMPLPDDRFIIFPPVQRL